MNHFEIICGSAAIRKSFQEARVARSITCSSDHLIVEKTILPWMAGHSELAPLLSGCNRELSTRGDTQA